MPYRSQASHPSLFAVGSIVVEVFGFGLAAIIFIVFLPTLD